MVEGPEQLISSVTEPPVGEQATAQVPATACPQTESPEAGKRAFLLQVRELFGLRL